jgi:uncharacterized membrane protein
MRQDEAMTVQPSPADTDRPDREDDPSRSDGFVGGLSEVIGGPIGEHAAARGRRPGGPTGRFWTAARIVLALTCLTLALHWVQKSPCQNGDWQKNVQYTRYCYTDVLALYYSEGLNDGAVPYVDHKVEYPVVTGYFMGALGLPVHALGRRYPGINQGQWFYNANALVLCILAVATAAVILALRRRRPWDAAIFGLSPILLLTATINWDFLAIGFAAFGLYAWARRHPLVAGLLLGLGGAAKLWPLFILGPLVILGVRAGRPRGPVLAVLAAAATWALVNLPVFAFARPGWNEFFRLNSTRAVDWGTFWYIGRYLDGKWNTGAPGDQGPFQWLSDHIPTLNLITYALFGVAFVAITVVALRAPRRPRVAQLAFLVVAAFLLTSKVWSQQYVLWLLPLIVLARPKWGAIVPWTVAEVGYLAAFYAELLGNGTKPVIPEGTFVLAATLRWITVAVLFGLVLREVWRPQLDAVRTTYADDPDGGVFDGAPDADWVRHLRHGPEARAVAPIAAA